MYKSFDLEEKNFLDLRGHQVKYGWCQQVTTRKLQYLPKLIFIRDAHINFFIRFHQSTQKLLWAKTNYIQKIQKKPDCQTFLNISSQYPKSLKSSILYSQPLRIMSICQKTTDSEYHLQQLKERFIQQGYNNKNYQSTIPRTKNKRQK